MIRVRTFALPLGVVLLLAGCGGGSPQGEKTVPGLTVQGTRVARIIPVHETEYKLTPSRISIERFGYYGIKAVNDGTLAHALKITGHGVTAETGDVKPGSSATMLVFFKKGGTYRLFCPIDGHAAKGMTATVKVH